MQEQVNEVFDSFMKCGLNLRTMPAADLVKIYAMCMRRISRGGSESGDAAEYEHIRDELIPYLDANKIWESRREIITYLAFNSPAIRSQIVKHMKVPRSTVYDNLEFLEKNNIVGRARRKVPNTRGAPHVAWRLTL